MSVVTDLLNPDNEIVDICLYNIDEDISPLTQLIASGTTRVTHLKLVSFSDSLNFNHVIELITHPNSTLKVLVLRNSFLDHKEDFLRALATPSALEFLKFNCLCSSDSQKCDNCFDIKQVLGRRNLFMAHLLPKRGKSWTTKLLQDHIFVLADFLYK